MPKSASANEIKKAYYQLAKQYHPDTNKDPSAKEKFVEIQEAYEILSDDKKRLQFDQFGESAFNDNRQGSNGFDPFSGPRGFSGDIFEQLFNGFRTSANGQYDMAGEDISAAISVTFLEAAKGCKKPLSFVSVSKCDPCSGSGMKAGQKRRSCETCHGSGRVTFMHGGYHIASSCKACGGSGRVVPPGAKCTSCNGAGRVRQRRTVEVDVPGGIDDNMRVRLAAQGDAPLEGDGPNGDLFVLINVKKHPVFKRDGCDVLADVSIPLNVALLGGSVRIPTIDGDVDLQVPAGSQPNDKKVLRKRGAIKLTNRGPSSDRGDQWVTLKVDLPKHLTATQKELIAEAFGTPAKNENHDSGIFNFLKGVKKRMEGDANDSSRNSDKK